MEPKTCKCGNIHYNFIDECNKCALSGATSPQAGSEAVSAELALLSDKVKSLYKELDREHHKAETLYFETDSRFEYGRTMALAEACSKLMIILNRVT